MFVEQNNVIDIKIETVIDEFQKNEYWRTQTSTFSDFKIYAYINVKYFYTKLFKSIMKIFALLLRLKCIRL